MEQTLSYETLYEIFRNEKNRDDIQELSPTFYTDVVGYLSKNKKLLEEATINNFSEEEKEDFSRQIKNIKNLIKEIYDRRETKILNLAVNYSRTKSESIEVQSLLPQEKEFYKICIETLDVFRKKNLEKTLRGTSFSEQSSNLDSQKDLSLKKSSDIETTVENKQEINTEIKDENLIEDNLECVTKNSNENNENTDEEVKSEISLNENEKSSDEKDIERLKIKFKEFVPKFLGKELEIYGPFEAGDTAELPSELARILLKKEKAEETL